VTAQPDFAEAPNKVLGPARDELLLPSPRLITPDVTKLFWPVNKASVRPCFFRRIVSGASNQPHARRIAASEYAKAIVLDFVNPARAGRRSLSGRRQTRLDNANTRTGTLTQQDHDYRLRLPHQRVELASQKRKAPTDWVLGPVGVLGRKFTARSNLNPFCEGNATATAWLGAPRECPPGSAIAPSSIPLVTTELSQERFKDFWRT